MQTRRFARLAALGAIMLAFLAQQGAVALPADALERPSVENKRLPTALMLSVARAGQRLVAVGERGIIQVSDDNGITWAQTQSPVSVTLTSVRFINASHGWSVGHGGIVLATVDGGKSWHKQLDGVMAASIMREEASLRAGSGREMALRDADRLVQEGPDKPFFDVYFESEKSGLIVGAYGLAFVTEDGGRSWKSASQRLPNQEGLHLFRIYADATGVLIAGERGLVLRGRSIGDSFSVEKVPYNGSLYGAICSQDRTCYVYGLRGNLLRLDNDVHTWSVLRNEQPVTITTSIAAPDKEGSPIFGDQAGRIFRIDTQTAQLMSKVAKPLPPINALALAKDGSIVAATVQGMVRIRPADVLAGQ